MYLLTRNPVGFISSLDLLHIPSWDLGMEARAPGWLEEGAGACLVVVLVFPSNGQLIKLVLDVLDTKSKGDELGQVLAIGLPTGTLSGDKARFAEALKILTNSGMVEKDVDMVVARSAALVDCFWNFRDALWGADQPLGDISALGRHENPVSKYSWVLSRERNGALFPPVISAAAGMGSAPGAGYAPQAPLGSPAPVVDPPKSDLGPPPGTEGKGPKGKKPPVAEGDKQLF
jgi:hypothetical protein